MTRNGDGAAVLFDFGGTLDGDGLHWPLRFFDAYRRAGGSLDSEGFAPFFRMSDQALVALPEIRSLGFRAAIDAQVSALMAVLPEAARLDGRSIADRLHGDGLAAVERNRPMLARLARRFRLGVVSNFTGNLEPCLAELDLLRFFGFVADSGVLGVAKPDRAIFERALQALDAEAARTWMVGDNPEADIRPAQALGMRTCWLAPSERQAPEGLAPTARIARLTELEPLLG